MNKNLKMSSVENLDMFLRVLVAVALSFGVFLSGVVKGGFAFTVIALSASSLIVSRKKE